MTESRKSMMIYESANKVYKVFPCRCAIHKGLGTGLTSKNNKINKCSTILIKKLNYALRITVIN